MTNPDIPALKAALAAKDAENARLRALLDEVVAEYEDMAGAQPNHLEGVPSSACALLPLDRVRAFLVRLKGGDDAHD